MFICLISALNLIKKGLYDRFLFRMKMYPHVRNGDVGNEPNPERFNLLSIAYRMFETDGLNNLQ